jgi:hypothetical protein
VPNNALKKLGTFLTAPLRTLLNTNVRLRDKLLFAIGFSAIVWYFVCITCIGLHWVKPDKRPGSASASENPDRAAPSATPDMLPKQRESRDQLGEMDLYSFMAFSITAIAGTLATFLGMVLGLGQATSNTAGSDLAITPMQTVAAWCYFSSLLYALAIWGYYSWQTPPQVVHPVISSLGQSILGLFGGVLAVILNVDSNRDRRAAN